MEFGIIRLRPVFTGIGTMEEPPRVADYFLVAGLPTKDPQLLDNDSLEVNLRSTANQDPITDICVSVMLFLDQVLTAYF